MKNYISELITRYFIKRHNSDTEIKIQKWLIEDNQQRLKEIALINIWKNLNSKADKSVYRSLKEVNLKIGLKSSKRWFMMTAGIKKLRPGITISRLRLFCRRQMQQGLAV